MRFTERLFRRFVYKYYARNLLVDLQILAKKESIEYIREHMRDSTIFPTREAMLRQAVKMAAIDGTYLEFGVAKGESLNLIADQASGRTVHGFDSFQGLPEAWSGTAELGGKFSTHGKLPKVRPNAQLHVGLFGDTLPGFLAGDNKPIAFLHVDCDLYSSTKTVFDLAGDRLVAGSVIVFDEYFNYPNWQQHEYKAFQEFVAATGIRYRYFGFGQSGGQVGVVIEGRG